MRTASVEFSVSVDDEEVEADSGDCSKCGLEKTPAAPERERERYPWLVEITSLAQPRCLGTLISSRYVVTAGHCVVHWVEWKRKRYMKLCKPREVKVVFLAFLSTAEWLLLARSTWDLMRERQRSWPRR